MAINDGGTAFPCPVEGTSGMSLRDYFAAAALTGLLASPDPTLPNPEGIAKVCYRFADAMIVERNKE